MISLLLDRSSEGLLADSVRQQIEQALSHYYGHNVRLSISLAETDSADSTESNEKQTANETPAQRSNRLKAEKQQLAEKNIANDPFVVELQNRFGAQIVPGSVKPKLINRDKKEK